MKLWKWVFATALVVGLLSGSAALDAAAMAQPPIRWLDIPFVFFGSVFGPFFVIGLQIFRRDSKPSLWMLRFFGPASAWFAASGISALILAFYQGVVAPYAVFILAVGTGSVIGVLVSWRLFHWRYKRAAIEPTKSA